jgi:regulatory protein
MEIQSFKKLKDNKYKIIFKNNSDLILYDDIILKYNLLLTKKIDESKLKIIIAENNSLECYYKALKYLSNKNRSKLEIIKYLNRFNYSQENINETIEKLEKNNYINEDIYLESFINDQINLTNNGPKKIYNKLINLGFKEEQIKNYLDKIDNKVWLDKLEKIIKQKVFSNKKDGENKIKERILYNLINEGFQREDIINILNNIEIPTNEEALIKYANKLYIKLSSKYANNELYYVLKNKLALKGFKYNEIDKAIEQIKNI